MKGWFWGWLGKGPVNTVPLDIEHAMPSIITMILNEWIESVWFEDGAMMFRNAKASDPEYRTWWLKEER